MFDPTAASTSVDSAVSSIAAAGLMSYLIEWLKQTHLIPWVTASRTTLLRWLNGALAAAVALGIHYTFDAQAGIITITGLTRTFSMVRGKWVSSGLFSRWPMTAL
jgi:hypothetical protein